MLGFWDKNVPIPEADGPKLQQIMSHLENLLANTQVAGPEVD